MVEMLAFNFSYNEVKRLSMASLIGFIYSYFLNSVINLVNSSSALLVNKTF